jgi:hypothetical protein
MGGDDRTIAIYEEWQQTAETWIARNSTVVCRAGRGIPNGLICLHMHKMWLPQPHGTRINERVLVRCAGMADDMAEPAATCAQLAEEIAAYQYGRAVATPRTSTVPHTTQHGASDRFDQTRRVPHGSGRTTSIA